MRLVSLYPNRPILRRPWPVPAKLIAASWLGLALAACGPGPAPPGFGEHAHEDELIVGSTAPGGGNLAIEYDFSAPVATTLSASVGGFVLYRAADPGFDLLRRDEPADLFYALPDGVDLEIEIVAIAAGARLRLDGATLDAPGESASLGTTPVLEARPEWQLVLAEDETPGEYEIRFRLISSSPQFSASEAYAVTLVAEAAPAGSFRSR